LRAGFFEAGCIDHPKCQITELAFRFAPVAGDTGGVVDQSQTPSNQPIEQSRLTNIRPTDDGDGKAHGR
jgi:hypothetical protein